MTRFFPRVSVRLAFVAGALPLAALLMPLAAQSSIAADKALLAQERFVTPPPEVARLVAAPRQLNATLSEQSPDKRHFLALHGEGLGNEQQFGRPHYYLGGLQVDYGANRARTLTTRGTASIEIVDAESGARVSVQLPSGATASSPTWSPDGAQLAYFANFENASYVYVADARTGASRRLSGRAALPVLDTSLDWAPDASALYAVLVPENRMPVPTEPVVADGPIVRMTTPGEKDHTRTYASLLNSPHEKALLTYYGTGQLVRLDAKGGTARIVGSPAMIQGVDVSPDGQLLRVTVMDGPYSYGVQYNAFGSSDQIWTADGRKLVTAASRPTREGDLVDDAARSAADSGRRALTWYPGGGIAFLLQDPAPKRGRGAAARADTTEMAAGDSARGPKRKDRLYVWTAPFDAAGARPIVESDNKIAGVVFTTDGKWALLSENAAGVAHTYAVSLADPSTKHTIYKGRGAQVGFTAGNNFGNPRGGPDDADFYANPGTVVLRQRTGSTPQALVSSDGRSVYLEGTHYDHNWQATAPRTFIDKVDVATGTKSRLFESDTAVYESNPIPVDDDFSRFVVTRETETVVPDQWLRDRTSGQLKRLTENKDVTAEITRLPRKLYQITRADGYKFWTSVTLPANYREGTRLPAMFWFYPYEYTDQASYDKTRRTYNVHKFPVTGPRSIEIMATQGYAVVQPDAPIVGSNGRMNDNYVNDLRNNLSAVIDDLDAKGIIDRQRLGLGGHSYGAFSTVNAMVNTPFFKAGIAGDGNYNRTLTPTGFQSERRDFWDARESYLAMSPLLYADRLNGALLMYHSLEDQNTGTDPQNSIRLYHALRSMGKTASLYMYPYEDHGPLIKETVLDQWGRWVAWLDLYVKNAGKTGQPAGKVVAAGELVP